MRLMLSSMMKGNYTDLRALCCIIDKGSFVAAARELQISRSALSETIRRLERQVGVQLLNRTTRSVSPTPTGTRLATRFAEAFLEIEEALMEASTMGGETAGRVRVHAQRLGYELFLRPLLPEFARHYPRIEVEVLIDDADVDIVSGGFDAAIRLGELVDQDAIAFALQPPVRQVAVASPSYIDLNGMPVHPRDLRDHRCICFRWPGQNALYRWEFFENGAWFSIAVSGPLVFNDQRATLDAALAGAGVAFWVESEVQPYVDRGLLVPLLTDYCADFPGFALYYPPHRHRSAAVTTFITAMRSTRAGT